MNEKDIEKLISDMRQHLEYLDTIIVITQNYMTNKFSAEVAMQNIIDTFKDKEG